MQTNGLFRTFFRRPAAAKFFALTIVGGAIMLGSLWAPARAHQGEESPPPNPLKTDAAALIVRMVDSAYVPPAATIKIGQIVRFENDDSVGHTVTALDGSFDSGYLGKGDAWRTSFTRTQTIRFADIYHPSMHGSITVTN